MAQRDEFTRSWIIENAVDVCSQYGHKELTIRALYYRLVSRGMTNSQQHYKRVVAAMDKARWDDLIEMDYFVDRERDTEGETKNEHIEVEDAIEEGKENIKAWMNFYNLERWSNQPYYVEVLIEKKALQSVFEKPCRRMDVALSACKGYPSLTFLHDVKERIDAAVTNDHEVVLLYFGDYDPSGEDIPRSIEDNLRRMGAYDFTLRRVLLMEEHVKAWKLPPAPAKLTDSRTANWDGLGQVELDAVEPHQLQKICTAAIETYFDTDLYNDLMERESEEREEYRSALRTFVNEM